MKEDDLTAGVAPARIKKCTWCGKEYSDATNRCTIDGNPLELVSHDKKRGTRISSPASATGRPAAITVICCLGFSSGFYALVTVLAQTDQLRAVNSSYPLIMLLNGFAVVVCMFGLLKMRRWGLNGYTGLCVLNLMLMVALGASWGSLTLARLAAQGIIIAVGFAYLRRMN